DGKLMRRSEPIAPDNAVSILIPGGEWDVVLKAPARAPVAGMANLQPGAESRMSLDRAPSGLSVTIRSVQTDGKTPVPRASVRWKGLSPLTLREITLHTPPTPAEELLALSINDDVPTTDAAGNLRVQHLPVQSHSWTLTADGFRTAQESVEVRPNDAQKSVTVAMRPLPDIVVTVEDRAATPIRFAVDVSARAPGEDTGLPLRTVWSGNVANGAVHRLARVKELEYRFDLRDDSRVLLSQTWISPADKVWQQDVIPVRLVHEPRTVRGKVTRGEEPVAGVFLYADVQTRGGPEVETLIPVEKFLDRAARSGADGSYSMEIGGPGVFRIRYSIPEEHVDGTAGTVDLTTAMSADLDFSIARNRLAIEVVSAKNGNAIPQADLRITMGKPNGRRGSSYDAQTDDQGRYVAAGLEDVRATVRVSADGYETRTVDLAVGDAGDGTEPARVELQPVGSLRFRIGDARGIPISGAQVVTLEEPAPGDIDANMLTVARSDASGLAGVEHPGGDSRPYFFLARGWQLELVTARASEDNPEIPVALTPIQSTYPLRILRSTGDAYASIALAFRRSGVMYPWPLLGAKVNQEGRDLQATLVTDAGGWILIHALLAPGAYDVYLFAPADMRTRMRHLAKPLGPLTLPLQTETTLTSSRDAMDGGRR
ncbi:MAG TPA: carboxypeptidase-like regulatory domain-containing protein, partial [Thermoanaerobaculia bacterium]|nr:carboxypeptidase-like regulatory domain-containing protein [Thermoanaerobaculia bacterium]